LLRDLQLWQELEHKNVVPVYGVVQDFGPIIAMVMPDVGDINLTRYLNQIGDELTLSTRFMLVGMLSLLDI
jgi:serine/threonine protein kinase